MLAMNAPRSMNPDRTLQFFGMISGPIAGIATWLNWAKDIIGYVGVVAGAAVSVWALYDRIKKSRKDNAPQ